MIGEDLASRQTDIAFDGCPDRFVLDRLRHGQRSIEILRRLDPVPESPPGQAPLLEGRSQRNRILEALGCLDERIVEANGKKILNLQHLIQIVDGETDTPYVVFKTKRGKVIALERKKVKQAQAEILKTYHISSDRSLDLKPI